MGVAVDSSGNVWVTDIWNHFVEEWNQGGSYVQTFGTPGTGNGQFNGGGYNPWGIAVGR